MKIKEVDACSFSSWYSIFKSYTFKCRIIPLEKQVIHYLLSDGIVLPKGSDGPETNANYSSDNSDSSTWSSDEDNLHDDNRPSFPIFDMNIRNAIKELGNSVFPKLNWSSPRDAIWMLSGNKLLCHHPSDVYLVLKSSNFIMRDLTEAYILCDDYDGSPQSHDNIQLVLKKYYEVNPAGEFRCFVQNKKLFAICQRHCDTFYYHIYEDRKIISEEIVEFFNSIVCDRFSLTDYVFDIYRPKQNKIYVIDFNPFGCITDCLLYDWTQLNDFCIGIHSNENDFILKDVCFRYVNHQNNIQPNSIRSSSSIPKDFLDLCCGNDINKLIDLLKLDNNIAKNK